ncbi:MAG: FG-GAP-like repeat-containing protein [Patescibacteria group bacterium]|jgi:hypothetical protein
MTKAKRSLVLFAGVILFVIGLGILPGGTAHAAAVSWTQINTDGFGSVQNFRSYSLINYNSALYASTANTTTGTEIWKYVNSAWTQVNTDGFGSAANVDANGAAIFNGNLYYGVTNGTGAGVWKYDGTTFTQVNTAGFGDVNNTYILALQVFNSRLYASTYNFTTGVEVWQYDGTTWTQVNTDGFGSASNVYSDAMAVYNNKLVVGAANLTTGGQLWQYDGTTWTSLNVNGFGDVTNKEPFSLLVDGSTLYAGTWNDTTGTEMWKYDGTTWTQLGTDGLGDVDNSNILQMVKFNYEIYLVTRNLIDGGEVWQYNGTTFTQANTDGFGDINNLLVYNPTDVDHHLFVGTWNVTTGAEIWQGVIADTVSPTVASISPARDATSVAKDANVSFSLDDDIWGIDSDTLDVSVDNKNAIVDGVWQPGFSGSITSDGDRGYAVIINPGTDFLYGRTIGVTLRIADHNDNIKTDSWSFTIGAPASLGIVMTPASAGGPNVRVVTAAGRQISSFFAFDRNSRMGMQVNQADIDGDGTNEIVVTPGQGVESTMKAFELNGTLIASTLTYNKGFRGGVAVATGDFNGDNKDEVAVAPIIGGGPNIRIYSLNTTTHSFELMDWFFAYEQAYKGGVNLVTGDVDGDGVSELVVAPISGRSPLVKVYNYNSATSNFDVVDEVTAYQSTFRGGVQIATGDVNGDNADEIIVSPYVNGGPNVRVYALNGTSKLVQLAWVMAYPTTYRGTLSMQVGDVDGDGSSEIVLVAKTLGDSTVKIFRYQSGALNLVDSFMAYDSKFAGGVNLFVNDVDGDGYAEVMTSPASRGGPNVRVYDLNTGSAVLKGWFWAFPIGFRGGVNFGQ